MSDSFKKWFKALSINRQTEIYNEIMNPSQVCHVKHVIREYKDHESMWISNQEKYFDEEVVLAYDWQDNWKFKGDGFYIFDFEAATDFMIDGLLGKLTVGKLEKLMKDGSLKNEKS